MDIVDIITDPNQQMLDAVQNAVDVDLGDTVVSTWRGKFRSVIVDVTVNDEVIAEVFVRMGVEPEVLVHTTNTDDPVIASRLTVLQSLTQEC